MADRDRGHVARHAELEARIVAATHAGAEADFDGTSWWWMFALGLLLPIVLILLGWWLGAAP